MLRKIIVSFLLATGPVLMQAQLITPPLLTTTGSATVQLRPDLVILKITVEKKMNIAQLRSLINFNIFDKEKTQFNFVSLEKQNITEMSSRIKNYPDEIGMLKEFFVTITDIKKYEDVMLKLYYLGFDNIQVYEFRSSKITESIAEARHNAVANARAKALSIALDLEQTIGKAHTVEDSNIKIINPYFGNALSSDASLLPDDTYSNPGLITILVTVKISFDLIK